jgi:hypothetical protein
MVPPIDLELYRHGSPGYHPVAIEFFWLSRTHAAGKDAPDPIRDRPPADGDRHNDRSEG